MGTRKPKNPTPEARRHFPHDRIAPPAPASKPPEVHQTDTKPAVFRCPKCGQTVATIPTAEAWCLPCGARMQPVKGKARP